MIEVFYGDDRVRATRAIEGFFGGAGYEVVDCAELTPADLPTIFLGATLFDTDSRRILLRDFFANKTVAECLVDYLETPHRVAILELRLDKRGAAYKAVKDKVKFTEFKLPQEQSFNAVFDIYRVAKRDGAKAVEMLRAIEEEQEPMMFLGVLASQAIKDFAARQGAKEKRALVELSRTDLQMKSGATQPWLLLESFLLRASSW